MSLNCSYICRSNRSGLERLTKVSRKRTPFSANRSPSLMNAAFTASGVVATVGQERLACTACSSRGQAIDHREEDDVQRLLGVHLVQQVMHVRNAQLRGEARVDGAALGAFLVQLLAGVIRVDDVLRLNPQRREVAREHRRLRVHVEHARHADAHGRRASSAARRASSARP